MGNKEFKITRRINWSQSTLEPAFARLQLPKPGPCRLTGQYHSGPIGREDRRLQFKRQLALGQETPLYLFNCAGMLGCWEDYGNLDESTEAGTEDYCTGAGGTRRAGEGAEGTGGTKHWMVSAICHRSWSWCASITCWFVRAWPCVSTTVEPKLFKTAIIRSNSVTESFTDLGFEPESAEW